MAGVLFIGNFLSRSTGSYSVSEFVATKIAEDFGIAIRLVSRINNRVIRFFHILLSIVFYDYSVLHIDVFSGSSFLFARIGAMVGKIRGKKVLLTLHGGALHEHYKGRERVFSDMFKDSLVQTPSLFLKNFFEQENYKVSYCPNPILLSNFPYRRDSIKPQALLWVRAFSEIYNPHLPVRVLKRIRDEFPEATLTMIGPDKGLMNLTKELIRDLDIEEYVTIVGPVKNDRLFEYYQSHSIFLNTPSYESFGVAVVEAASCGIPVVSTKVGEIPFLWTNDENILMADNFDYLEMASQVMRLFKDKSLAEKLSLNARRKAEDFSWDNIKPYWLKILRQ